MKKVISVVMVMAICFCMASCGATGTKVPAAESDSEKSTGEQYVYVNSIEELEELVDKDVTDVISALEEEYGELVADITDFNQYVENKDSVEAFYDKINEETEKLCMRIRDYSVSYVELIINSDMTYDDMDDAVDDVYECLYDDAGDAIYDGIYDGILDDMYDYFYSGIVSDGYDTVPYDEWYDASSDEYDMWFDSSSDVYDYWSDAVSDVYGFWSDVSGAMWDNDIDEVKEEIEKFKEDIEKLKA